ncbi:MAG: 3-deoxy-D-manno-octulosonic acid transferase [Thermodesulfobacteriota bacterium]|nr:3-deoxy-D-manno-octulosonic acid transferase [Thermodesulfobacteriota bacterium]
MALTRPALIIYNLLQVAALPCLGPPALLYLLSRSKYRGHLAGRLGRLPDLSSLKSRFPRIWVHALSVGEVNAASVLVTAISQRWQGAGIICSATTATGLTALKKKLGSTAHVITTVPFDLLPLVNKVIKAISPDCFILVETDVWPNWIWSMQQSGIPTMLVNGSLSSRSGERLLHLGPVKDILYGGFDLLAMQSPYDRERLLRLGFTADRVTAPGNLKYDLEVPQINESEKVLLREAMGLEPAAPLWVAGSTHPGEEELILAAHKGLKHVFPGLQLLLAPRDPKRGQELESLAREMGFNAVRRSAVAKSCDVDIVVLDTLGELLKCYSLCDVAFIGGTLVNIGGHNLLEPAAYGVPVLFGPYMESARTIAEDLLVCGGGRRVSGKEELQEALKKLLEDSSERRNMGGRAKDLLQKNQGAVSRYLDLVAKAVRGIS